MRTVSSKAPLSPAQWKKIDLALLAGDLPLRAIAGDYGITEGALRKRMKARGIVRNLGKKIQARADAKLAEAVSVGLDKAGREYLQDEVRAVTDPKGPRKAGAKIAKQLSEVMEATEERHVENVATAVATIIGRHRAEAHQAQVLVAQLVADLTEAARHRFELEAVIEKETESEDDEGKVKIDFKRRNSMFAAISLPTHAKAAQQLVAALDKAQEIARRAWGITDGPLPPAAADEDEDATLLRDIKALALVWDAKVAAAQAPPQEQPPTTAV